MSEAGEFVDYTLQRESSWEKAYGIQERAGKGLKVYGASVGAVRGTIRDTLNRYRNLGHDDITALSTELWAEPVFERRLAAVVLLQTEVGLLTHTDLTRLEGFIRQSDTDALAVPLANDVVRPLLDRLEGQARDKAIKVLQRWRDDPDPRLQRAAGLVAGD
ncbi:DNA alkylation repair protein [Paenarthrobacter sp. NPDC089675]|uniref:DNA alkylation repair protein n=1 Tax=Paenarthrobacter sp. NPDC089675 TaxID=3364376 RepID=UPI00381861E7